ncbi:MAG: aminotransferase DegT [Clostridia bacterium]|jgi:dTDP-4-amino-4,6-dideoxygalactose transaminase|nr:aminotransferase DegT [Clostridia bacterium]
MLNKIFLSSPTMNGNEKKYIDEAFDTNWIAPLGPNVDSFESEIASYVGIKHAAALITGTAAIHLALKAAGVDKDDIVFCSSLTFSATCNPIIYQNAIPIFIDSEPETWNMSPNALKKALVGFRPKAVLVVNLYGNPAKLNEISEICREHNIPLIEDAAESLGATYMGKHTGTFGKYGIYSFNGNKIITTSGGGMLVSEDEYAIKKVRFWATQSRDPARHYQHSELGYNYRMSNICAGIGRGQLCTIDEYIKMKKNIYYTYKKAFEDIEDIKMNPITKDSNPNYWLSCIELRDSSPVKPLDIIIELENENIEARPIWKPMNLQPFYKKYIFINDNINGISVGEDIFNRGLCLPSDIKMKEEEICKVIEIIRVLFKKQIKSFIINRELTTSGV